MEGEHPPGEGPWVTRSALELVAEFGELVAAGHLAGELVEGDVGALLVQHGLAELQDDEVVTDQQSALVVRRGPAINPSDQGRLAGAVVAQRSRSS